MVSLHFIFGEDPRIIHHLNVLLMMLYFFVYAGNLSDLHLQKVKSTKLYVCTGCGGRQNK